MYVTRGRAPISAKKRFDSKILAFLGTANMGKVFDCTKYLSYFFMLAFIFCFIMQPTFEA